MFTGIGGVETTDAIFGATICAVRKVSVFNLVPLEVDPKSHQLIKILQNILLATLLFQIVTVNRSTAAKKMNRVFHELALPRTEAAVGQDRRRARSENREPRTASLGGAKRRSCEVDGPARDRSEAERRAVFWVGGIWGEEKRRGVGFVAKNREREVVNGDCGVRG